jgi:flavin-dependent dehydrogenase
VAVLEKNPTVGGPVCCTGIVSRECIARFSIPSSLILKELKSATIFPPSVEPLKLERPEVQAAVIDRGAYNAFMAREAQEQGADYLMSHRVTSVLQEPDGVVVTAENNGNVLIFEARGAVMATGFSSRLPEQTGFGRSARRAVGAQVKVTAGIIEEVEIFLGSGIAPGFFGWVVPTSGTKALVGLLAEREANLRLGKFLSLLKARGIVSAAGGRPLYRGVTLGPPKRTYGNRILLAGDAAGQVKPLTGGGIYFGLLCADIAASTLHKAMEASDFSAVYMRSYEKEWKHLLGSEIRLGDWASRLYGRLSDRTIDRAVEAARKRGIAERLSEASGIGFDWHGSAILQIIRELLRRHKKPLNKAPSDK